MLQMACVKGGGGGVKYSVTLMQEIYPSPAEFLFVKLVLKFVTHLLN